MTSVGFAEMAAKGKRKGSKSAQPRGDENSSAGGGSNPRPMWLLIIGSLVALVAAASIPGLLKGNAEAPAHVGRNGNPFNESNIETRLISSEPRISMVPDLISRAEVAQLLAVVDQVHNQLLTASVHYFCTLFVHTVLAWHCLFAH